MAAREETPSRSRELHPNDACSPAVSVTIVDPSESFLRFVVGSADTVSAISRPPLIVSVVYSVRAILQPAWFLPLHTALTAALVPLTVARDADTVSAGARHID